MTKAEFTRLYEIHTLTEIAEMNNISVNKLWHMTKEWGIALRPQSKTPMCVWQGRVAYHLRQKNWTLQRIADLFGCSRQNVHILLKSTK